MLALDENGGRQMQHCADLCADVDGRVAGLKA